MLFQETKATTDHTIVLHELLMAIVRIEPPDMRLVLPASINPLFRVVRRQFSLRTATKLTKGSPQGRNSLPSISILANSSYFYEALMGREGKSGFTGMIIFISQRTKK